MPDTKKLFDKTCLDALLNPATDDLTKAISGTYISMRNPFENEEFLANARISKAELEELLLAASTRESQAVSVSVQATGTVGVPQTPDVPGDSSHLEEIISSSSEAEASHSTPFGNRPANFDGLIAWLCDPERASDALQNLDLMWETHWSVRLSPRTARWISTKNALFIVFGGAGRQVTKIGVVGGFVKLIERVWGAFSL